MTYEQMVEKIKKLDTKQFNYGLYITEVFYKNRWFLLDENNGKIKISTPIFNKILGEIFIEKEYDLSDRETAYNNFYELIISDLENDCYFGN